MRRSLLALALFVVASGAAHAQTLAGHPASPEATAHASDGDALAPSVLLVRVDEAEVPTEIVEQINTDKRFGIGTGSAFFTYGLSGTYDLTDTITAEAIVGLLGSISSIGGRAWYRFNKNEAYDVYGHAGVGFLSFGGIVDETAIGVSGGVGIEAGLPQLTNNEDFPPIFLNLDIGVGFSTFEFYNYSAFSGGGGIHYKF